MSIGDKLIAKGLHSYGAEPVTYGIAPVSLQVCAAGVTKDCTFAHVLDVQASEEVRPEDATKLFFPEVFAVRHHDGCESYLLRGLIWNHIREELLRLSSSHLNWPVESLWTMDVQLYAQEIQDSFVEDFFSNESPEAPLLEIYLLDDPFGDERDDEEDEPDTLNSELLLSNEYLSPADLQCGRNDKPIQQSVVGGHIRDMEVRAQADGKHDPESRVETTQPIEPKE